MDISESNVTLLREVRTLFGRAEGLAKSLETLALNGETIGLFVPSINELRYAGQHVLDSLLEPGAPIESEIKKAQNHCQRAIYDACDAHIQVLIFEIDMFQKDFSEITIGDVLPTYLDIHKAKKKALLLLENGRHNDETREQFCERAIEEREALERLCADLPYAREELNKKVISLQEDRNNRIKSTWIGISGIFLGILAALFPWIATLFPK